MSLKKLDLLRIITSSNYLYNFSSSYSNKALTASYAMNGGGGGGTSGTSGASGTSGTSGTSGVSGTAGSSGTSATAGSSGTSGAGSSGTSGGGASLNTGSKYPITSSWSVKALTASYIANFPIINNVQAQIIVPSVTGSSYTLIRSVANSSDIFVSINGVVQIPSSSYTISGNTINFSQVPTSGSRIDVRFLLSGNNISSSYALTASYSSNGGGGGSGTSGTSGASGSSGNSGTSGSSGTSGQNGSSGSSGNNGSSGTSGSSGSSGNNGSSGTSGGGFLTGSTYPITSSFSRRAITASYSLTSSYALNGGGGGGQAFPFSGSAIITGSLSITKTIKINNVTLSASNGSLYLNNSLLRVLRYNYFSSSISSSNIIPVVNVRTQIINGYSLISADFFAENLSSNSQANVYVYNGINSTLIQTVTINQSTINVLSLSDYVPLQISASGYLNFRVTASVI
jgi:hypothetical protein